MGTKIGFIGLGEMGKWMARNILKAGFDLTVLDMDPEAVKFLTDQGAESAATAGELAALADWIFLSLPSTAVVEKVIFGTSGIVKGASAGSLVVDCGTTGYLPTLDFEKRLKKRNIGFADAPVSGMEARAKEGTLTVMFGGDDAVFDRIRPVLDVMSNKVLVMGGVGSGQLTKLINQLLFNVSCAAVAEMLPMSAKLGLDPEKVTEVITSGTGRSFAAEFFAPLALDGIFDKGYALKHAYKDMISASEISAHHKIPLPMVQACTTTYQMALAEGFGDQGKGAMMKVFERLLDVKFRRKKEAV
ncbi:MAG: NAD(P)-dependent oxidoreductase [Deltaproteobacteria bacterium]|jgi:3-hydroxyisobutyrate dehydrogenase-like beta-hydroxyacid dehydrogenase|nr:NAD(P)-dependent oxidoreductase [Deltaproteobacteria bacterium]